MKPLREKSDFMKVMAFNRPKIAIFFAVLSVAIAGVCQPILGWLFADMLITLSIPIEFIKFKLISEGKPEILWKNELETDTERLAILMVSLGGLTFVTYMLKSYLFMVLGENVTIKVREVLYKAILEKNIGWFDL